MSGDPTYLVNDASDVVQIVILVLGIYRALVMRRGFIDFTYRSRALWSAFLMVVIVVTNAESLIPLPNNVIGAIIGFVPFAAIVLGSFAFVDRTVLVAVRSDFFHRNPLHWSQFRKPASAVITASSFLILAAVADSSQLAASGPQSVAPLWVDLGFYQFFLVAAAILGYSAIALIVAARRTSDNTLRKSIRLLGIALGFFVVSLVTFGISFGDASEILGDMLTLLATYVLYLSVMSLTSLGKVERDA